MSGTCTQAQNVDIAGPEWAGLFVPAMCCSKLGYITLHMLSMAAFTSLASQKLVQKCRHHSAWRAQQPQIRA